MLQAVSTSVPNVQPAAFTSIDTTSAWRRATSLVPTRNLAEMFAVDGRRHEFLVLRSGDLTVDFSRQRVDRDVLTALVDAAAECDVRGALERMFAGEPINTTEGRSVGHVAIRMKLAEEFRIDGIDVMPEVRATLDRMSAFAESVRRGDVTGSTGLPFSTVVNIGIGGSDLGPRLVHDALRYRRHDRIDCRFIANIDPDDFVSALEGVDPADTLFVVSSKTFTTTETLSNARLAADWIRSHLGDAAVAQHIVAVSSDERAVKASGLGAGLVFPLWEWVGGRYSIGSAVGLSAMLSIGPEAFFDFLAGMQDLDSHVRQAELSSNVPLIMALVGIWNHSVLGYSSRAMIPYSHALQRLPAYLQQLIMESNGKSVRLDGSHVGLATSPIIWGDQGTNAQHAFMQLLHQGTSIVPVDFIGFARSGGGTDPSFQSSQRALFMNMVAQAQALAFGRATSSNGELHRSFDGDRPSTVITAAELTPRVLGQIIAVYEHAVFYEGVLLGINSFDQWGVELGKEIASDLMTSILSRIDASSPSELAGLRLVEWFDENSRTADN